MFLWFFPKKAQGQWQCFGAAPFKAKYGTAVYVIYHRCYKITDMLYLQIHNNAIIFICKQKLLKFFFK